MGLLDFDKYQRLASETAEYPNMGDNYVYPALGVAGEAGEVAEKVKKQLRNHNGEITDEFREKISKELGDVLWYIAAMCTELNLSMNRVAKDNLLKLRSRAERGVIKSEGDER